MLDFLAFMRFINLMQRLQQIERKASVPGRDTPENDVEHSYQLAAGALYLVNAYSAAFVGLDPLKIVIYALFHDLAEVHAGDLGWSDPVAGKQAREAAAIALIREEFPEFPALADWLDEYESLTSPEARFIKQLDKLLGTIIIYLSGGASWRANSQSMEWMIAKLNEKLSVCEDAPLIRELCNALVAEIREHPEMFPDAPPPATSERQ